MTDLPHPRWLAAQFDEYGQIRVDTWPDAVALVTQFLETTGRVCDVDIRPHVLPGHADPVEYLVIFQRLRYDSESGWYRGDYYRWSLDWTEEERPDDVPTLTVSDD